MCVDDGSSDLTGKILDEYHTKDERFVVIHQANAGVSAARNVALDIAKGDWILFIDGDDLYHPRRLEYIRNAITPTCDLILNDSVHSVLPTLNYAVEPRSSRIKDTRLITSQIGMHSCVIHNACYKRKVFQTLRFAHLAYMEDVLFLQALYGSAKEIVHLHVALYNYIARPGSAMLSSPSLKRDVDMYRGFFQTFKLYAERHCKLTYAVKRAYGKRLIDKFPGTLFTYPKTPEREALYEEWLNNLKIIARADLLLPHHRLVAFLCGKTRSKLFCMIFCIIPYKLRVATIQIAIRCHIFDLLRKIRA